MPPPALSTFLVSDLAELEWQQFGAKISGLPGFPGPLFKNLSQATCVGARKSNSARATHGTFLGIVNGSKKLTVFMSLFVY